MISINLLPAEEALARRVEQGSRKREGEPALGSFPNYMRILRAEATENMDENHDMHS